MRKGFSVKGEVPHLPLSIGGAGGLHDKGAKMRRDSEFQNPRRKQQQIPDSLFFHILTSNLPVYDAPKMLA